MGYLGKIEDKIIAQKLRRAGSSYKEILEKIHVSKDTISRWCRDIKLTESQEERLLRNKVVGQKKGSLVAANNKRKARVLRTKLIYQESKKDIGSLSKRDKFIAGLALYAGEGSKNDGQGGFANSNPLLIRFMSYWFVNFAKIPKHKLKGAIWLHKGLNEENAREYWSNVSRISINDFYKTYIVRSKQNNKVRKNIHKFGVFSIRFSDSNKHRRIMGWISAMLDDKIPQVH